MSYTIIQDTLEKRPWNFAKIADVTIRHLSTGDYSLEDLEDLLCIERKGSITEFCTNIFEDRFKRCLERMSTYKYKYVLLEFTADQVYSYPRGCGIPPRVQRKLRVRGPTIMKNVLSFQHEYNVNFVFCGTSGLSICNSIFKRVLEWEKVKQTI